ncbi:membrane-targeted effector domain-containing toxin [Pseudomonas typographi]|nr:membrane-targeted effector domain-containing toxin [Pseudomonas typographi]MBD1554438.1 membrane-targeted effector domain-containing toxin [Pseudomonas typographi]
MTTSTTPDLLALHDAARAMALACPDLRQMARQVALDLLADHGIHSLDPDAVYWHRFSDAASSPRTYTGWAHYGHPVESLTLVQLVMRRFSAQDQDAADNLRVLSGFYTVPASAEAFDEAHEVRLLPDHVLQAFWNIAFKTRYTTALEQFWQQYAQAYRTLAKATFIAKALEDRQAGYLSDADVSTLLAATAGGTTAPANVPMLERGVPLVGLQAHWLNIGGYQTTDIVHLVAPSGRRWLYVPGQVQAFHAFESLQDLHWWLLMNNNAADNRAQFLTHFSLSDVADPERAAGLTHTIDLLYTTWGSQDHSLLQVLGAPIHGDLFSALRDRCRARMASDAAIALRGNGDLRKQMWMGYLSAVNRVFGPMAALDWPVALAVVGAGLADMGLNIDQAVNGSTTAQRQAGVVGAISGAVELLFNSVFLWGAWAPEAPLAEAITPVELAAEPTQTLPELTPGRQYPATHQALLETFESNVVLGAYTPQQSGLLRQVYMTENGRTYIQMGGFSYAVRYTEALKSWVIIDPENPFSFYRSVPVRLNAAGEWELAPRPGLRGGGKVLGKFPWVGRRSAKLPAAAPTPYDAPADLQKQLAEAVLNPGSKALDPDYVDLRAGPGPSPAQRFEALRDRLYADSRAFYRNLEALPQRPAAPSLTKEAPPRTIIDALYEHSNGVIIGEAHADAGSKHFLIANMPQLAKARVRTLYLEHLLTDFHQADLDVFAHTGKMPDPLRKYLQLLDHGHATDPSGRYTFLTLVQTANAEGLRIRAIDCLASYRLEGLVDHRGTARQQIMNYFSHEVITADQSAEGAHRWLALVGNSHTDTYLGVPGLADLEAVLSIRAEDVAPGTPTGFAPDPGITMPVKSTRRQATLRSDLRLRTAVPPPAGATLRLPALDEQRLAEPGDFSLREHGAGAALTFRDLEGALTQTHIYLDGKQIYVQTPALPAVSGRRFDRMEDLAQALQLMGMHAH